MIRSKFFYFVLVFLFPFSSYACSCVRQNVAYTFQQAEFVAKAKIVKISPDTSNLDYHEAVIEIISLYKGTHLTNIKILSSLNTSCGFMPKENTTWIIFAHRWQGVLSFGYCSGSIDLDRTFDPVRYPNANSNYRNTIKLKQGVVSFLAKHKIPDPNPAMLYASNARISSLKGYQNKNSFAVFQVEVNSDLSIARVKQLKKFKNNKLNKLVYNSMRTDLKFQSMRGQPLSKPARVILFCFFYDDGYNESFLSFLDL
jgi:hypothetical protein